MLISYKGQVKSDTKKLDITLCRDGFQEWLSTLNPDSRLETTLKKYILSFSDAPFGL